MEMGVSYKRKKKQLYEVSCYEERKTLGREDSFVGNAR